MFFRKRRRFIRKADDMLHVIDFLRDLHKDPRTLADQPFTLGVGEVRQTFAFPEQALPFIAARSGQEVKVFLGTNPQFGPSETRYIGVEFPHERYDDIEKTRLPPGIWIRTRYTWVTLWRWKMSICHQISDETEQLLADRLDALRLERWIPLPGLDDCERIRWLPNRDVMPPDFEEVEEAPTQSDLMSATSAPKQRSWAIEPIAQRKKTTLISGDPGMGKSQIALDFAMRVTRGIGMPGHPNPPAPAGVMICENEDDWDEDVIPRLIAVGANRKLIRGFFAADLHTREGVARLDKAKKKFEAETRTAVGALILSPYMACFGGGSTQEQHMRQKLAEIERWQKEVDIAILGVAHLGGTGDVAGPKTFKRAARGSWKVVVDENDPERNPKKKRRLLIADKVNNTADDFTLAYRIKGVTLKEGGIKIETSKIVWEDPFLPTIMECDEGLSSEAPPMGVTDQVVSVVKDLLKDGPVDSSLVRKEIIARGFSAGALHDATKRLGIKPGTRGKSSPWSLP